MSAPIWAAAEEVADPLEGYMTSSLLYTDPSTDLRAPAATAAREPAGPRATHLLRAGWRWLVRLNDWKDNCWIGHVLGGLLFGLIAYGMFLVAGVLETW